MKLRWLVYLSLAACLAAAPGCGGGGGPETAPVSGKVTVSGKAIEGAQVNFVQEGAPRAATGTTDAEGRYRLTTFKPNDGAVLGKHKVTIAMGAKDLGKISAGTPDAAYGDAMRKAASGGSTIGAGVPGKYANPATSGLTADVKPGKNENVNFDLQP